MQKLEVHSCNNGHDMRKIGAAYDETDNSVVIFDGCGTAYAIGYVYVPVKHGHWVWNPNAYDWNLGAWCCSECGRYNSDIGRDEKFVYRNVWSNFCNCCGAKMDEVSE